MKAFIMMIAEAFAETLKEYEVDGPLFQEFLEELQHRIDANK